MSAPVLLVAAGVLVLGAALVALDRFALVVVRPPRRPPGRSPADLSLRWEDVVIPSEYPLRGWLLEPEGAEADTPVLILSHGWAANAAVLLDLAARLVRSGLTVLLFDYRAHGRSEGAPYVTIRHYRDDMMAAARWTAGRYPGRPLVLGGHSMGGAAAVLAVAEGAPAAGVVLIAAPADVLEVTADYISERGAPGALMIRLCAPYWRLRHGERYARLVPERRIGELAARVLVVQPEHDQRVGREHGERLASAAGVEPRVVEGTGHTDVLEAPETARLVERFVAAVAENSAPARGAASEKRERSR